MKINLKFVQFIVKVLNSSGFSHPREQLYGHSKLHNLLVFIEISLSLQHPLRFPTKIILPHYNLINKQNEVMCGFFEIFCEYFLMLEVFKLIRDLQFRRQIVYRFLFLIPSKYFDNYNI